MASVTLPPPPARTLQDADLKEHLHRLRVTDNSRNWWYLLAAYLYLGVVLAAAIACFEYRAAAGLPFWWDVPMALVAVVLVGAGQHRLTALAHESSHHTLFRNRMLNDLAGDLLCMFPVFGTLYHYRLQHHAHHQFVNDPDRDPDVSQLQTSGHWLDFPVEKRKFVTTLLKQLWPPNLLRFIRVRAQYNSVGTDKSPYLKKGWKPARGPKLVGVAYLLLQAGLLTALVTHGDPLLLALAPLLPLAGVLLYFWRLPEEKYHQSRVKSYVHMRWMTQMRIVYFTAVFVALAWASYLTGSPTGLYFVVLWGVPLLTSFAFFMVLRQLVQHGNGGRGWLTNTRVFLVHRLIRFAVFPYGQEYHLPHHMYASVPHYRLKELHELLLGYPEYAQQALVVDGYFFHGHEPPLGPTVLEVVGPDYAPEARDVFIDDSVLEGERVEDRDAILREGANARRSDA